jgi:hypothetical protein
MANEDEFIAEFGPDGDPRWQIVPEIDNEIFGQPVMTPSQERLARGLDNIPAIGNDPKSGEPFEDRTPASVTEVDPVLRYIQTNPRNLSFIRNVGLQLDGGIPLTKNQEDQVIRIMAFDMEEAMNDMGSDPSDAVA